MPSSQGLMARLLFRVFAITLVCFGSVECVVEVATHASLRTAVIVGSGAQSTVAAKYKTPRTVLVRSAASHGVERNAPSASGRVFQEASDAAPSQPAPHFSQTAGDEATASAPGPMASTDTQTAAQTPRTVDPDRFRRSKAAAFGIRNDTSLDQSPSTESVGEVGGNEASPELYPLSKDADLAVKDASNLDHIPSKNDAGDVDLSKSNFERFPWHKDAGGVLGSQASSRPKPRSERVGVVVPRRNASPELHPWNKDTSNVVESKSSARRNPGNEDMEAAFGQQAKPGHDAWRMDVGASAGSTGWSDHNSRNKTVGVAVGGETSRDPHRLNIDFAAPSESEEKPDPPRGDVDPGAARGSEASPDPHPWSKDYASNTKANASPDPFQRSKDVGAAFGSKVSPDQQPWSKASVSPFDNNAIPAPDQRSLDVGVGAGSKAISDQHPWTTDSISPFGSMEKPDPPQGTTDAGVASDGPGIPGRHPRSKDSASPFRSEGSPDPLQRLKDVGAAGSKASPDQQTAAKPGPPRHSISVDAAVGTKTGQALHPWSNDSLANPKNKARLDPEQGIKVADLTSGNKSTPDLHPWAAGAKATATGKVTEEPQPWSKTDDASNAQVVASSQFNVSLAPARNIEFVRVLSEEGSTCGSAGYAEIADMQVCAQAFDALTGNATDTENFEPALVYESDVPAGCFSYCGPNLYWASQPCRKFNSDADLTDVAPTGEYTAGKMYLLCRGAKYKWTESGAEYAKRAQEFAGARPAANSTLTGAQLSIIDMRGGNLQAGVDAGAVVPMPINEPEATMASAPPIPNPASATPRPTIEPVFPTPIPTPKQTPITRRPTPEPAPPTPFPTSKPVLPTPLPTVKPAEPGAQRVAASGSKPESPQTATPMVDPAPVSPPPNTPPVDLSQPLRAPIQDRVTGVLGNPAIQREFVDEVDEGTWMQYVFSDKYFQTSGQITSIKFFAGRSSNKGVRFQIYRMVNQDTHTFKLAASTPPIRTSQAPAAEFWLAQPPIPVEAGDYIGFAHEGNGIIMYDMNGDDVMTHSSPAAHSGRTDVFTFVPLQTRRNYSFEVAYVASSVPKSTKALGAQTTQAAPQKAAPIQPPAQLPPPRSTPAQVANVRPTHPSTQTEKSGSSVSKGVDGDQLEAGEDPTRQAQAETQPDSKKPTNAQTSANVSQQRPMRSPIRSAQRPAQRSAEQPEGYPTVVRRGSANNVERIGNSSEDAGNPAGKQAANSEQQEAFPDKQDAESDDYWDLFDLGKFGANCKKYPLYGPIFALVLAAFGFCCYAGRLVLQEAYPGAFSPSADPSSPLQNPDATADPDNQSPEASSAEEAPAQVDAQLEPDSGEVQSTSQEEAQAQ